MHFVYLFYLKILSIFILNEILMFWAFDVIEGNKREAVDALEKQLSAKRQKRNAAVEQTVQKLKSEAKTQKKKKKEETSSSDDSSSSDSEKEEVNYIHI